MGRTAAGVIASSLLVLLGISSRTPESGCPVNVSRDQDVAWCDNRPVHPLEPVCIEDQLFENLLAERGGRLIELGRTVSTRVLVQQLQQRPSCQLELLSSDPVSLDPVDVYQRAKDSVVVVAGLYQCRRCSEWHASKASGFVLSSSGAVVTNYHVVDDATREALFVMTADQRVFPVEEVLAASRADDLAILRVSAKGLQPLPIADTPAAAQVGSPVGVISHPDGRFYCYTSGIISRYMKIHSAGQPVERGLDHRGLRAGIERCAGPEPGGSGRGDRDEHRIGLLHGRRRAAAQSADGLQDLHSPSLRKLVRSVGSLSPSGRSPTPGLGLDRTVAQDSSGQDISPKRSGGVEPSCCAAG